MDNLDLNNISNNLYMLLLSLNRQIFNPHELSKKFNIPHSHIKVLFYLLHHGPKPISSLAKELCVSKPNMTPVIDKLVYDGLVTRDYDPNDRRVIIISITQKAIDLIKSSEMYIKKLLNDKLSHLNDDDLVAFSNSLDSLLTIIKKF